MIEVTPRPHGPGSALTCWTQPQPDPPDDPDPPEDPDPPDDPDEPDDPDDGEEPPVDVWPWPTGEGRLEGQRSDRALVMGRFRAFHRGHMALIATAQRLAKHVVVGVCLDPFARFDVAHRARWIRTSFPGVEVVPIDEQVCSRDVESVAFWTQWAAIVKRRVGDFDLQVSSDRKAWRLAEMCGARHYLFDPDRRTVPISSSRILADLSKYWRYLAPPVQHDLALRVRILGPEQAGKSTLCSKLARNLGAAVVPEALRIHAEERGGWHAPALRELLTLHQELEARAMRRSRLVVYDTDITSLALWCERWWGQSPAWLWQAADKQAEQIHQTVVLEPLGGETSLARSQFQARVGEVERRQAGHSAFGERISAAAGGRLVDH